MLEFLSQSTDGTVAQGDRPSEPYSHRQLQALPEGSDLIDWIAFCNVRAIQGPAEPVGPTRSGPDSWPVDSVLAWYDDKDDGLQYLVKWKGFSFEESTWVYVDVYASSSRSGY